MLVATLAAGMLASTMSEPAHPQPVNPKATKEARQLLDFLYAVKGKYTLSGQHNQLYHMGQISEKVEQISGKYPVIWGSDWGFSDERHDIDNIKYRPKLLNEIRAQHKAGRIVVITYHQASPTVDEPCDFRGGVQIKITESDWDAILTDGTPLHKVWQSNVDRLAEAFATMQKEHIPIIFRPYHEMNGSWFWWGGKPERFKPLWSMTYDRFVNKFKLNNLLWAWTPDKPYPGVEDYFPGLDHVDLLGTDIYPAADRKEAYPQEWYDRMKGLAGDKPLALSEMSLLPTAEELERQPWSYFMAWDDLVFRANKDDRIKEVFAYPRVLSEMKR